MDNTQLDKEIIKMNIEYNIDAFNAQIKQHKKSLLEAQKTTNSAKAKIDELKAKVVELEEQLTQF
jgi:hypothetical protein